MSRNAQNLARRFHGSHSSRTWSGGNTDPWLREVLLQLQVCLNGMAKQIDENSERLDRVEAQVRRLGR